MLPTGIPNVVKCILYSFSMGKSDCFQNRLIDTNTSQTESPILRSVFPPWRKTVIVIQFENNLHSLISP